MTAPVNFIHLTDLHIGNPAVNDDHLYSNTSETLENALKDIKALEPRPSFIIASGDLTNRGDVDSFKELKRIFAEAELDIPVVFALGNHDTREGFYREMLGQTDNLDAPYFHAQVIDGVDIIALDSSAPKKVGGNIEEEQFDWLEEELESHPDLPKLIVSHHPPILDEEDESGEWEAINIGDTQILRDMLEEYDVVGILSGHIHYDRVTSWYGIPLVVGIGHHAATDIRSFPETFRMVSGSSFALGTIRPSGMTISFVPSASDRRELHSFKIADLAELIKKFENSAPASEAAE